MRLRGGRSDGELEEAMRLKFAGCSKTSTSSTFTKKLHSAKQLFVQRTLTALGPEALEERLQSALMSPPAHPSGSHALSERVDACLDERAAPRLCSSRSTSTWEEPSGTPRPW